MGERCIGAAPCVIPPTHVHLFVFLLFLQEREGFHHNVVSRWRNEDEISSKQMRKLLRRKMTRLSLGYLNQAERLTQQTVSALHAS